jgi:hypothetical protein
MVAMTQRGKPKVQIKREKTSLGWSPWPVLQGPATIAKLARTALLSSKTVEQPVSAGAAQVALAATAIGPA